MSEDKNQNRGEARAEAMRIFSFQNLKEQARYCFNLLVRTSRMFVENRGPYQANALAYRTMVSLVPMLAFMVSLLAMFMGRGEKELIADLRGIMEKFLVPDSSIMERTFEIIEKFITQAKQGTVLAFIILLLTSVFLINAVETIFNNIWHIRERRPWGWRILSFTAMTVLIPTMLGLSIYMTARVSVSNVTQMLGGESLGRYLPLLQGTWRSFWNWAAPLALTWALFLAMFKWLPNTKVETSAALIGSFLSALGFEVCKVGFSYFAARMVMSRQYWWGSLGVFLVFLMWVYLIWLIVLYGAQLAYVLQNYRYVLRLNPGLEKRVGESYLACRVMLETVKRHLAGEEPPSVRELAGKLEVEVPRVQEIVSMLREANLLLQGTANQKKKKYEEVYVPGRDPARITVGEVIRAVNDSWRLPGSPAVREVEGIEVPRDEQAEAGGPEDALDRLLARSRKEVEEHLQVSFRELAQSPGSLPSLTAWKNPALGNRTRPREITVPCSRSESRPCSCSSE